MLTLVWSAKVNSPREQMWHLGRFIHIFPAVSSQPEFHILYLTSCYLKLGYTGKAFWWFWKPHGKKKCLRRTYRMGTTVDNSVCHLHSCLCIWKKCLKGLVCNNAHVSPQLLDRFPATKGSSENWKTVGRTSLDQTVAMAQMLWLNTSRVICPCAKLSPLSKITVLLG